jgi:hypothetical protein
MQEHFYPNWELNDLGIWDGHGKVNETILCLIASTVPSIKSFWGEPLVYNPRLSAEHLPQL